MNPTPTDDDVARLPLQAGRAELLEQILRLESGPAMPPSPWRRRWFVPAAAAAVVAVLAVSATVFGGSWSHPDPAGRVVGAPAPSPASASVEGDPQASHRVLVTAPGWHVTSPGPGGGIWRRGDDSVEITTAPARLYAGYVEDREHIVDPPAPGAPLTVLGAPAQLWAYPDPDDFTVIRSVVDGEWMELRGQGLDEAGFRSLLDGLRLVSTDEFERDMPPRFITAGERPARIDDVLDGITDVVAMVSGAINSSGQALPQGADRAVSSQAEDPYQLGADVVNHVACAWLGDYESAVAMGNSAEAAVATAVMATSRQWPVLKQMDAQGDYPEAVWHYADRIAAGQSPDGYQQALGC